jgi:hypothetical protein
MYYKGEKIAFHNAKVVLLCFLVANQLFICGLWDIPFDQCSHFALLEMLVWSVGWPLCLCFSDSGNIHAQRALAITNKL